MIVARNRVSIICARLTFNRIKTPKDVLVNRLPCIILHISLFICFLDAAASSSSHEPQNPRQFHLQLGDLVGEA